MQNRRSKNQRSPDFTSKFYIRHSTFDIRHWTFSFFLRSGRNDDHHRFGRQIDSYFYKLVYGLCGCVRRVLHFIRLLKYKTSPRFEYGVDCISQAPDIARVLKKEAPPGVFYRKYCAHYLRVVRFTRETLVMYKIRIVLLCMAAVSVSREGGGAFASAVPTGLNFTRSGKLPGQN